MESSKAPQDAWIVMCGKVDRVTPQGHGKNTIVLVDIELPISHKQPNPGESFKAAGYSDKRVQFIFRHTGMAHPYVLFAMRTQAKGVDYRIMAAASEVRPTAEEIREIAERLKQEWANIDEQQVHIAIS